jgi:hypothetical protein
VYKKYSQEEFKSMAGQIAKSFKAQAESFGGSSQIVYTHLQAYLETPGVLRQVYKISRLFVMKNSHLLLIGPTKA